MGGGATIIKQASLSSVSDSGRGEIGLGILMAQRRRSKGAKIVRQIEARMVMLTDCFPPRENM